MKAVLKDAHTSHPINRIIFNGVDVERREIQQLPYLRGEQFKEVREQLLTLRSLLAIRDSFTWAHTRRVMKAAIKHAEKLGLSDDDKRIIYLGSMLHDIGKIGISDSILLKPSTLTAEEYNTIKYHTLLGANLIGLSPNLVSIIPIVLYHHERIDGKGYPMGLKGTQIPIIVRIVTIADAFEAMVSDRPYRKAFSVDQALEEMKKELGKQFDRALGKSFISIIEEERLKIFE